MWCLLNSHFALIVKDTYCDDPSKKVSVTLYLCKQSFLRGKMRISARLFLCVSAAVLSLSAVFAEESGSAGKPHKVIDTSGTDPTLFLPQLRLVNEYVDLRNGRYSDIASLSYVHPFADGRMNVRTKLPFVSSDVGGSSQFNLGDISARYNWLATINQDYGLLLGAELVADSAQEDVLGRGQWSIQPLVTYAMFLGKNAIFAPTYQHNKSFAEQSSRTEINESVVDLYLVFTSTDKERWVTIDPAIVLDWENNQSVPISIETQVGSKIATIHGAALNIYVAPGVGVGSDRPYDYNLEAGFTLIGF
jgi:hypothetical protein